MKYYVYALVRPEDFRPFYVGATGSPNPRASVHRRTYGKDIHFLIVGEFEDWREAARVETETIEFYRSRGVALTNHRAYHPYSPRRSHLFFYVRETIRPQLPALAPCAPRVAQPYRWKRLTPMSEVGATLAALSGKLALLPASEVARFLVQEQ